MRRSVLALALLLRVANCQAAESVFDELKDNAHWFRTIVVPSERINITEVEAIARDFLFHAGPSRRLVVLEVFSTRHIAAQETAISCGSYKQWRLYFDEFPKSSFAAAEMIAVGEDAVLRIRTPDGTITRRTLRGSDPTRGLFNDVPFEILTVSGRKISNLEKCEQPDTVCPIVYVKTTATLTESVCNRMFAEVAKRLGSHSVIVQFRNDHWFHCGYFPVFYPFSEPEPPPTEEVHGRSLSFTCRIKCGNEPSCTIALGPGLAGER